MKLTHLVPKPIRQKLYPYKEKLYKKIHSHNLNKLKAELQTDDQPAMTQTMRAFSEKYGTGYMKAMLEKGWITPGRMYDEIGEIFAHNNKLFIIGEQDDVDRVKQKVDFMGIRVDVLPISAQQFLSSVDTIKKVVHDTRFDYTVIVAYQKPYEVATVSDTLVDLGWHFLNANLFSEEQFCGNLVCRLEIYMSIFSVYVVDKVYLVHNNMLTTTVCNLNCEHCLNYTPYDKHPKHFSLENMKSSADMYFSCVDRVGLFQLSGGEPMLCPYLQDILTYIYDKYRQQIEVLNIVTNATIIPSDDFCKFLKTHNILVYVDDYSANVPKVRSSLNEVLNKFNEFGVNYIRLVADKFMITFPPMKANMQLDVQGLQNKYRLCFPGVQNLRNGKICSCTYHAFAVNAGLLPDSSDDWFDLEQINEDILDKRALVEFRCGFNKKGYVDWCRYCNGHITTINNNSAPAAQQVKGKINWDINNPTFLD